MRVTKKKKGFLAPKKNSFSVPLTYPDWTDVPFSLDCQSEHTCLLRPEALAARCVSCSWQRQLNIPTGGSSNSQFAKNDFWDSSNALTVKHGYLYWSGKCFYHKIIINPENEIEFKSLPVSFFPFLNFFAASTNKKNIMSDDLIADFCPHLGSFLLFFFFFSHYVSGRLQVINRDLG